MIIGSLETSIRRTSKHLRQLTVGSRYLGRDVLVKRDRRSSITVTQMADCAERRVLALLKHLIFSVEPIRCGSAFSVHEYGVSAIHGGGEVHGFGAEILKDWIGVVVDQKNRGNSLFGPELDLLLRAFDPLPDMFAGQQEDDAVCKSQRPPSRQWSKLIISRQYALVYARKTMQLALPTGV
jgi:hypothetical protein